MVRYRQRRESIPEVKGQGARGMQAVVIGNAPA
jgi:hypothetical protein